MPSIFTNEQTIYPWFHHEGVSVRGYAFHEGELKRERSLAQIFKGVATENGFTDILKRINGFYAVIIENEATKMAAVDRIRSFPLTYAVNGNETLISDSAESLREHLDLHSISYKSAAEYLIANFVTGKETLFPEIKQLTAGQYLVAPKGSAPIVDNYFKFSRDHYRDADEQDLIEELDKTHYKVFERLAEFLNGRTAVVPLSGGYDSRLIAVMLDRVGYDNIHFVSYGPKNNWESKLSREIARYYNKKWTFVPTSRRLWYKWFNSPELKEYASFAHQLSTYAHIQDFPVVKELKESGELPDDSVFIPGHSGGFMSGSHTPLHFMDSQSVSIRSVVDHILKKNYSKFEWERYTPELEDYFSQRILQTLDIDSQKLLSDRACDLYEEWVWQERQAKLIVHSIRVYEYWGYEWSIPLWDNGMMDFWLSVDPHTRADRNLYNKYIAQKHNLPFRHPNYPRLRKANKAYNPFAEPHYGRFIGDRSIINALFTRVQDILDTTMLPFDFIRPDKKVIKENSVALVGASYLQSILKQTNAKLVED